ncbi:hypothetical protein WV31_13000 [Magnetospirillum sp. ME-1]|uniref:hypothetical protein n=1 Tax=Magnetospirillum sp. ME-1 TaxID=1639348 RepID=UPI000A17BB4D|nr:hypothetical protein [Magnetospirillum sp. ME-1]ARJ66520.1 hypothetical protein WV31_13000 [Magnetospirillum sp. ME-1]
MLRIGLDFDNTLAGYDRVFAEAAVQLGLLPAGFAGGKTATREALRAQKDGETAWQRLQGQVYGRFMPSADLIEGVAEFLDAARRAGANPVIVSHKTEFGHFDPDRISLRQAALEWMEARGFFGRFGLKREDVHFLSSRAEKVARIAELRPDLFIDDLPEVFEEPDFPATTQRLLFTNGAPAIPGPWRAMRHWDDITRAVFGHG